MQRPLPLGRRAGREHLKWLGLLESKVLQDRLQAAVLDATGRAHLSLSRRHDLRLQQERIVAELRDRLHHAHVRTTLESSEAHAESLADLERRKRTLLRRLTARRYRRRRGLRAAPVPHREV